MALIDKSISIIDMIDSQKLINLTVLKLSKNLIKDPLNIQ